MPDGCADCSVRPGPSDVVPCYSETFAVVAADGGRAAVTLRLCLACGARFADRAELRGYLAGKLPAPARTALAPSRP